MSEEQEQNIDFAGQHKDRAKKVNDLLAKKDLKNALLAALENPPLGAKDVAVRKDAAKVVANVLLEYKDADIKTTIDALNQDQLDLLMKYVYKSLETGENNSTPLFKWHKAIVEKAGNGAIIRALVERKTI